MFEEFALVESGHPKAKLTYKFYKTNTIYDYYNLILR